MPSRHLVEGGHQRGNALARLERADEGDERAITRHAERAEQGAIGTAVRFVRREPHVVDAVRGHNDRGADVAPLAQPLLRDLAHTDKRSGAPCGAPNGATKERRLGAKVPFGMIEEGAVVDRDNTGNR